MIDAAVIGGGLAGLSAAIVLASQGARVMVFEAKSYPHHKVCGEFLSPESAPVLHYLGVEVGALRAAAIHRARLTVPDGGCWETMLPGAGLGVSLYALDAALAGRAQAAGATVRERTTVTGVRGTLDDGFEVETRGETVRARVVIGAQGKRSGIDRVLSRGFMRRSQPYVGLKAHFRGMATADRVELHTFSGGYCGASAIEDGLTNVCLLAREAVLGGSIPALVARMTAENPYLRAQMAQAEAVTDWLAIAQVPFVRKALVERDVLMTGDAAGLIAPLAGDGMSMALAGGQMAAETVMGLLRGELSAQRVRAAYPKAWRARFGQRLRVGYALQQAMLSPQVMAVGVRIVRKYPGLGDYFVRVTRG